MQIGLVLEGGGGKGAYQIGVWKYLHEKGLDRYVGGVSGTSVGALNAALFAAGDYGTAERIWRNITQDQILSTGELMKTTSSFGSSMSSSIPIERFINQAVNQALFTRDGLRKIMDCYLDTQGIQHSTIPCYATCLEMSGLFPTVKRFELRCYSKENIKTILLASSAIPVIFDPVWFDGKSYCDGGLPLVGDNTPIRPLYDRGIRFFIVVHLTDDSEVDYMQFPGACILEITPQRDLGNLFTGMLDFSPEGAARRIEQGYQDARRVFDEYYHSKMGNQK